MRDDIIAAAAAQIRAARDASLGLPKLLLPAVPVNMRAGHLPEKEGNGVRCLKVPLDGI
jgi:hypothetical protein